MRALIRFFASRGTVAQVFTLLTVLLGLGALTVIQRDNFPSVDFEEMTVITRYPGASPEDVELNLTNEIEKELKQVDGLLWVHSFSMVNISIIYIRIDPDANDKRKVKTDVRDAVSRVSELPPEVDEEPLVEELTTTTAILIIEVGLTGDIPYKDLRELARRAEKALTELPGVAESIWRQREQGLAPLDAAVEGTAAVYLPVLTTLLTTALAFAPMFFMQGVLGWRYAVIAGFLALLLAAFWYAGRYLDFVRFPTQSADTFFVLAELPSGSSLEATGDRMAELEAILRDLPNGELDSFVTRIGSHGEWNLGENENWAFMGVYLTPFANRARNADEIVEDLRRRMGQVDGIERLRFVIDSGGPPVGRPITIRIIGSDDASRDRLAAHVMARLAAIDGVKDLDRDDKAGKEQIAIDLDYIRLADAGLTVADVARNVRLAFDGEIVTSVRYGEEDVDFRVILEERARRTEDTLRDLIIPNRDGRFRLSDPGQSRQSAARGTPRAAPRLDHYRGHQASPTPDPADLHHHRCRPSAHGLWTRRLPPLRRADGPGDGLRHPIRDPADLDSAALPAAGAGRPEPLRRETRLRS